MPPLGFLQFQIPTDEDKYKVGGGPNRVCEPVFSARSPDCLQPLGNASKTLDLHELS